MSVSCTLQPGLRKVLLTVGVGRVVELATGVVDQIQGPSEELVDNHLAGLDERGILKSLSHLGLSEGRNAAQGVSSASSEPGTETTSLLHARDLVVLLEGRVAHLGSSSGDKDLVSGQVAGSSVVLAVL